MVELEFNSSVNATDYLAIQRFMYYEALLLDERAYLDWFCLLTDDIHYKITTQVARATEDGIIRVAIIDEDMQALKMRVDQISNPKLTHAENPPTLTRRLISNIQVSSGNLKNTYTVKSNLLLYENRAENLNGSVQAGKREDFLIKIDRSFRIAQRIVDLDQTVLSNSTLSLLL